MALTDEQILGAIKSCPPVKHDYAGWVRDLRLLWGRAIEAAAMEPLLEQIAELERELAEVRKDAELMDFLESMSNGMRWIARNSNTGRGYRLHNDKDGTHITARGAIDAAMKGQQ